MRPPDDMSSYSPPVRMESWSWLLDQLGEPPLHTTVALAVLPEVIRVFAVRSFRPALAVRAERGARSVRLTRSIQGRSAAERRDVELPLHRWPIAPGMLDDEAFWRALRSPAQGLNGETWLLEQVTPAGYRNVESWCPRRGGRDADILEIGETLLALADAEFGTVPYGVRE